MSAEVAPARPCFTIWTAFDPFSAHFAPEIGAFPIRLAPLLSPKRLQERRFA